MIINMKQRQPFKRHLLVSNLILSHRTSLYTLLKLGLWWCPSEHKYLGNVGNCRIGCIWLNSGSLLFSHALPQHIPTQQEG